MKLNKAIDTYLASRRSLGIRLVSGGKILHQFSREMGDVDLGQITSRTVADFLHGRGQLSAAWTTKFRVLGGLYRFAIARGYVDQSPLPADTPELPPPLTPYVYSTAEIQRLLDATKTIRHSAVPNQDATFRTLLLLLYSGGLRVSEALNLKISDVNLAEKVLTIRDTKFYKTRLIPIGPRMVKELAVHLTTRELLALPKGKDSAVFAIRTGEPLRYGQINEWFQRVRKAANIGCPAGEIRPPRMHDLRHTAAVHRVIAWYRAGKNVQRLLPHLATYLGHVNIKSTQRYLHMTPELMEEASLKFGAYAKLGEHHE
jgi:integrase/recombinase XerD